MRVFVSGATGVVGRRAIPLLLAQGHSVTAIVRQMPDSPAVVHGGLTFVNVNLFDADALRRAVAPTYPDSGDRWIDETTPLEPSDYNRTVLDAEEAATTFSGDDRAGVVLRFAAFYGPDATQVKGYIDGLRRGLVVLPGGPDRYISSIAHDDAASAVVAAITASAGAYNVTDDEPVTRAAFFGSLADNLGLRQPRFLPAWATVLFGSVGEAAARSLRLCNRKLKEETGWAPRFPSVREGWPATLAEMKDR
jgi:2-alkyl-3-oxoalkanoate reductase